MDVLMFNKDIGVKENSEQLLILDRKIDTIKIHKLVKEIKGKEFEYEWDGSTKGWWWFERIPLYSEKYSK